MPRTVDVAVADNYAVSPAYHGFKARITLPDTLQGYAELWRTIEAIRARAATEKGAYDDWKAMMRLWSAGCWFFRLMFLLMAGRDAKRWAPKGTPPDQLKPHFWHPSQVEIARWVQFADHSTEFLIASRGIGKSTQLTLNDPIGRCLLDPNVGTVTFSHTREFALKHQGAKLAELRHNDLLKEVWDDRFFADPDEDAPLFSLKDGINCKRATARMEATFAAYAFVDGLPVGMHFDDRYYDDIEVDKTVEEPSSEEKIEKVIDRYTSSQDLASGARRKHVTGTYYSPVGPMKRLESHFGMTPRLWPSEDLDARPPAREAGPGGGLPLHGFTAEELWFIVNEKGGAANAKTMRSYARQQLCDPLAGEIARLNKADVRYYDASRVLEIGRQCNVYICQDPSPGINDPTWTFVWGLHPDGNYYWLDGFRARYTPARRKAETYLLGLKWNGVSNLIEFRVESFGNTTYAEEQSEYNALQGLNIPVVRIADNTARKRDREYEALQPPLDGGLLRFPESMERPDETGTNLNLVGYFLDFELGLYPQPATDDGLDAAGLLWARAGLAEPLQWPQPPRPERRYRDLEMHGDREPAPFASGIL